MGIIEQIVAKVIGTTSALLNTRAAKENFERESAYAKDWFAEQTRLVKQGFSGAVSALDSESDIAINTDRQDTQTILTLFLVGALFVLAMILVWRL